MRPIVYIRISTQLKRKIKNVLLLVILLFGAWLGGKELSQLGKNWSQANRMPSYALLMDKVYQVFSSSGLDYVGILLESMPVLVTTADSEAMAGQDTKRAGLMENALSAVVDIDWQDPRSFLGSQLAILKMISTNNESASSYILEDLEEEFIADYEEEVPSEEEPVNPNPEPPKFIASDKPSVAIYNSHNAETYMPTDGVSKLEGKNAGVAKVAARLAQALEEKQVKTIRSTTIHDYPSFTKSYGNSERTVRAMLSGNPSIQVVIDVHRDAGENIKRETVKINGKEAAKILLIVGSNARLEHPNWGKNKQFAEKVVKKMEQIYPGLSRGYRIQSGRYNQHLHPNAILIEVGSYKNSLEEAELAATLFADVVINVLADMQKDRL